MMQKLRNKGRRVLHDICNFQDPTGRIETRLCRTLFLMACLLFAGMLRMANNSCEYAKAEMQSILLGAWIN